VAAGQHPDKPRILDEAYLQLVDNTTPLWQGRTHFIRTRAVMRRIMVDLALW